MATGENRFCLGIIGLGQAGAMTIDEIRVAPDTPRPVAAGADPRPRVRKRACRMAESLIF